MGNSPTGVTLTCKSDPDYINGWDGIMQTIQSSYWINGQDSYHDNGKEDRRFKWRYCRPADDSNPFKATQQLSFTNYDASWERSCASMNGGNAALNGAISWHSNSKEDRQWMFYCASFKDGLFLDNCVWKNDVNSWDGPVNYQCRQATMDGVVRSIKSYHDNGKEDRRWSFECCLVYKKASMETELVDAWMSDTNSNYNDGNFMVSSASIDHNIGNNVVALLWVCVGLLITFICWKLKQKCARNRKCGVYESLNSSDPNPVTTYQSA